MKYFIYLFCCVISFSGERPEAMQTGTSTYQVNKHYIAHTLLLGIIISICNIFRDHYSSILFHTEYEFNLITDDITRRRTTQNAMRQISSSVGAIATAAATAAVAAAVTVTTTNAAVAQHRSRSIVSQFQR